MKNQKKSISASLIFIILFLSQPVIAQNFESSPFAILDIENNTENETYAIDIGVKWARASGTHAVRWGQIETTSPLGNPSNYDWTYIDDIANFYYNNNFNLLWTINPFNSLDQDSQQPTGMLPNDMAAYSEFITALVERYDGDGTEDAPGSPIINFWQVHNEVDGSFFWSDSPENYALLYTTTYDAINAANLNAKVALSGMANPESLDFFTTVLSEIDAAGGSVDIFDFHWFGFLGSYEKYYKSVNQIMFSEFVNVELSILLSNFDNYEIWITESGTHSGTDVINPEGIVQAQTETDQACELIKRYVYSLANNVKKIFWRSIKETASYSVQLNQNDFFDNTGLVYNGVSVVGGSVVYNPNGVGEDLGEGVKKLSYYAYKTMTEKLESCDWDNVETIMDNVGEKYAYKFNNDSTGKSTYIVWWDYFDEPDYVSGDSSLINLSGISSNFVIISGAVPTNTSGVYVTDYNTAFKVDTLSVSGNSVSFYLKKSPVFIEEYNATSTSGDIFNSQSINIYPNPTNRIFTIDNVQSFENIVMHNSIGELVYQSEINTNKITVDLSNQLNGIYFVHLKDKSNQNVVVKLIKE